MTRFRLGAPSSALSALVVRRPVATALLIFLLNLLLSMLAGIGAKTFAPQLDPAFVALLVMAAILAIVLSVLGWWAETGFNRPAAWRDVHVVWFPALVVLVLPFVAGVKPSDPGTFLYLSIAYALTGFMEEGIYRGLMMRVLQPTGTTWSVVLSALFFGLAHVTNVLYRNPVIVAAQMLGAFVHGIGLSAVRLRTNTIWFVIALHGLHDLALHYSLFPTIPLDVVQVTLQMLYGIYLLRTWHGQRESPPAPV